MLRLKIFQPRSDEPGEVVRMGSPNQNDFDSDEIEQIMNEIAELQEEMKINVSPDPAPAQEPTAKVDDAALMSEFHGGSDSNMEETLAHLPEEEPHGPSLLDQAFSEATHEQSA